MVRVEEVLDVGGAICGVETAGVATTALYQPSVSGVCWTAAEYQPSVRFVVGTTKARGADVLPVSVIGMAEAAGTMNRAVANAMSVGVRIRFIIGGASLFG